jgi:hypothetical protein
MYLLLFFFSPFYTPEIPVHPISFFWGGRYHTMIWYTIDNYQVNCGIPEKHATRSFGITIGVEPNNP